MEFLKASPYWFSFGEIIEKEISFVKIKLINDEIFLFEYSQSVSKQFDKLKIGESIGFWFEDCGRGRSEIKELELDI